MRELRTAPATAQAVRVLDHELRLLRLDPHPVTGKVPTNEDYSATLLLNLGGAAEAER